MRATVVAAVTAGLALMGCGSGAPAPVEQTGVWRLVPPAREPERLAAAGAWADRGGCELERITGGAPRPARLREEHRLDPRRHRARAGAMTGAVLNLSCGAVFG